MQSANNNQAETEKGLAHLMSDFRKTGKPEDALRIKQVIRNMPQESKLRMLSVSDGIRDGKVTEQSASYTPKEETKGIHWKPAVIKNRLGGINPIKTGEEIKPVSEQPSTSSPKPTEPKVISEIKPEGIENKQPLVNFEVFDGSGKEQSKVVEKELSNQFDKPVEGFIADQEPGSNVVTTRTTTNPKVNSDVNSNINRDRVEAVLNSTKIESGYKSSPMSDSTGEEVTGEVKTTPIKSDFENNHMSAKQDVAGDVAAAEQPEVPEITITSVEDPIAKEEANQPESPKVIDPTVVPIRVKNTKQPNFVEKPTQPAKSQTEITESTVQPAGETMVPATESEGQRRIEAAKNGIFNGDQQFDQMVNEEREINREKVIAPIPAQPGAQELQDQQPEVHIDGQPGINRETKPSENITQESTSSGPVKTENLNAHDYALTIGPNATSNQFAELLRKRKGNIGSEDIKQAA